MLQLATIDIGVGVEKDPVNECEEVQAKRQNNKDRSLKDTILHFILLYLIFKI